MRKTASGLPFMQKLLGVRLVCAIGLVIAAALVVAAAIIVTIVVATAIVIAAAVVVTFIVAAAAIVIVKVVDVLKFDSYLQVLLENALKNDLSGYKSSNHGGNYDKRAPKTFARAVFLFHFKKLPPFLIIDFGRPHIPPL